MAVTLLNIVAIQLSTTGGATVFAGSTTKATLIKNIILTNTGTATETVNLFLKPGSGTARQITPKNMQIPANAQVVMDTEITLAVTTAVADTITGSSTTASVDCVINGMQRDL